MRRPFIAFVLAVSFAVVTLPAGDASAARPHAAAQARKAGKKAKPARPQKDKAAKPKADKKKDDPGFAL